MAGTLNQNLQIVLSAQNQTNAAFEALNKNLNDLKSLALKVGAAIGGALAIKEVISSTTEWADQVKELQSVTGATAEQASRLNFVGQALGVSTDELNTSLGRLAKNMFSNSALADKGKDAFSKWGIALKDAQGHTRNIADVLSDAAAKVQQMGDSAASRALELDLFGKSGGQMHELLLKGAAGVQELTQQSDALGLTLNGQTLSGIKEFEQRSRVLGLALDGLKVTLGQILLPIFTAVVEMLTRLVSWLRNAILNSSFFAGVLKVLGEAFRIVLGIIKEVTDRLGVFVNDISKTGLVQAVVDLAGDLIKKVGEKLGDVQQWVSDNAPKWTDAVAKLLAGATQYVVDHPADIPGKIFDFLGQAGRLIGGVLEFMSRLQTALGLAAAVIGLSIGQVILNKLIDAINTGIGTINATLGRILGFTIPLVPHVNFESNIKELEDKIKVLLAPATKYINVVYLTSGSALPTTGPVLTSGDEDGGAGIIQRAGSNASLDDIAARYAELTGNTISAAYAETIRRKGLSKTDVEGGNPFLAKGGIVTRRTTATIGEAGPEAVIPLSRGGGWGGNTIIVNVSGNIATSEDELAERIAERVGDAIVGRTLNNRNLNY